ncbi:MAG: transglycosylase SLT domain-containing protein [Chloroflexota bacterium]
MQPDPLTLAETILVDLSTRSLSLQATDVGVIHFALSNRGRATKRLTIRILGLDATWVVVKPANLVISPGERYQGSVTISLEKQPHNQAGTYPFTFQIIDVDTPTQFSQYAATLVVEPFYEFTIRGLSPKRHRSRWSSPTGFYTLSIINNGNSLARFHVEGVDDTGACRFEFQPPDEATTLAKQIEFDLAAGEELSLPVQVTPLQRLLLRWGQRIYRFTITISARQGRQLSRTILGELAQKPLVGPGQLLLIIIAFILYGLLIGRASIEDAQPLAIQETSPETRPVDQPSTFIIPPTPVAALSTPISGDIPHAYELMFQEAGEQYDLDWRVLEALAYHESRMNPWALGQANDMGLMQVIPTTWAEWAPKVGATDPFDPYSNILVGATYLDYTRTSCYSWGQFGPDCMLIAYNWGPNRLRQFYADGKSWADLPSPQRNYVFSILEMSSNRRGDPELVDVIYANAILVE